MEQIQGDRQIDRVFITELGLILEALCNLRYMICAESNDPAKVVEYVNMSEERMLAMAELLRTRLK